MTRAGAVPAPIEGAALDRIELLLDRRAEAFLLLSPGVGLFTAGRADGDLLTAGVEAGVLLTLGRAFRLVVPPGVEGRIVAALHAPATRRPVGWGNLLYELRPIETERERSEPAGSPRGAAHAAAESELDRDHLYFLSPQSGRFYQRPSPTEDPFVVPGGIVEERQPVGLIEVMKTFAHVRYSAAGGLPSRARVRRILAEDGADVAAGDPLLEVAPVSSS